MKSLLPFQQQYWLDSFDFRAAVRNLAFCPLLLCPVTAVLQQCLSPPPSHLSHLAITGSTQDRHSGRGVVKTPFQLVPGDLFQVLWICTNSTYSFETVLWNTLLHYYNNTLFLQMYWNFSWVFFRLTFSIIPNAKNQIFQNPKYKASFLNFLKLVIWVKKNSVGILTHFT